MTDASETPDYVELLPFRPPLGLHEQPIDPGILQGAGFDPTTPQSELLLAQVALMAQKTEGENVPDGWYVGAMDALHPKLETSFGGIRIDDLSLSPREVLDRADTWIRESEATEWAPIRIMKLSADEGAISAHGVMLVRASRTADEIAAAKSVADLKAEVPTGAPKTPPRWLRWLPGLH